MILLVVKVSAHGNTTSKRYNPEFQVAGPDQPFGSISDISEVGELDAAVVTFNVGNASLTGEAKDYMIRLRNESNPLGALVTYNGQPMTEPFLISVDSPTEYLGCEYSASCLVGSVTPCGVCGDEAAVMK